MWKQRGQKRKKSASISSLEAEDKFRSEKNINESRHQEGGEGSHRNAPPPSPPATSSAAAAGIRWPLVQSKRGRKKKRLDEVVAGPSLALTSRQDQEDRKHGDTSSRGANMPSSNPMPGKRMLEFILDVFQRRDRHEIFAQPVDPEKVEGYYSIIKEPMDLGTMRTKLQEGVYSSLEQFERDVFLISGNAMKFNASATIYFRQARAINELAKRVFKTLKANPERMEEEFSVARRRTDKKSKATNLRRNTRKYRRLSSSNVLAERTDNDILPGYRDGRKTNLCGTERRDTYKPRSSSGKDLPSTAYGCPKLLVSGNGDIKYKESLRQFVQNLGPTAQMVANRKLSCLSGVPRRESLMPSGSVQNPHSLISSSASQQEISPPLPLVLQNFLANPMTTKDFTFPGRNSFPRDSFRSKGKNVIADERMEIYGGSSGGKMASRGSSAFEGQVGPTNDPVDIFRAGTTGGLNISGGTRGGLMGPPPERMGIQALAAIGENILGADSNISTYSSGFGGIGIGRGHSSHGGFREGSVPHVDNMAASTLRNTQTQIGSYLPGAETRNLSGSISMDGMMGSSQLVCQVQPMARSALESRSGPLEFMVGCSRRPRSSVYPSIVIKPSISNQHDGEPIVAQVGQPVEWTHPTPWGPQAINVQPSQLSHLGNDGFVPKEQQQQLTLDEFLQRQLLGQSTPLQSQQCEVNRFGEGALMQQQCEIGSGSFTQLLLDDEYPVGQETIFQQDMAQNLQTHPNEPNILSQAAFAEQGTQFGANSWAHSAQQLTGRPLQGPMLDTTTGNIYVSGPQQGQQVGMNNPQLLQNFQQQASGSASKYPDLNLQL